MITDIVPGWPAARCPHRWQRRVASLTTTARKAATSASSSRRRAGRGVSAGCVDQRWAGKSFLVDNGAAVPAGCLTRAQINTIAAGRCTARALAGIGHHLSACARCRSAIAARAARGRSLGDTVLLKPKRAPLPAAFKFGAVALSMAAIVAAWRYVGVPSRPPSPIALTYADSRPSGAFEAEREASEVPPLSASAAHPLVSSARMALADAGVSQGGSQVPTLPGPTIATLPQFRGRASHPDVSEEPSARRVQPATAEDDIDFGIDDPAVPTVGGRRIRTTLE